ncbi:hypothetical protein NC653_038652 [Populus alba x Populus x berolinensis]|uniref:Uncharacterized protein n=1 Tax=Populus alba x Populus x berolinensis TaxID=444605 RepID=A0AAD6LHJ6_9ROSI|nr:hypothetical protein NC653_038652 [Populus alba x Populus x berolinensis]
MTEPDDVSQGYVANVTANFLVFDGIPDRYLVVQHADQIDQRFPKTKMEWGFIESLSHDAFRDPSNGFLFNDLCMFAVEVFVIKSSGSVESFVQHLRVITFQLWISMPTTLRLFTVEGRNWYM